MTPEEAVRITYDAYNARDLPRVLANLAPDVEWDDGAGNMLRGKEAVAAHWREQWRKADARVAIETLAWHGAMLRLTIRLDVRKPDGSRAQQALTNRITFSDGLICAMRIG
jgi:nuclear transport factor 2 (NTF2) superfamily protein